MKDDNITTTNVQLSELHIDPEYQRAESKSMAKRLADNFRIEALDPILVGRRTDGSLWVVDGQSRVGMAHIKCWREIPARIFKSQGRAHEAELFKDTNLNRRSMKKADLYHACMAAGDKETLEIDTLLSRYGLRVSYSKGWPNISGVSKLYDSYRAGVLPLVLHSLTKAWPNNPEALKELTIGGLRDFWTKFPDAGMSRCIKKWASLAPGRFESAAQAGAMATGSRYRVIALSLLERYNSGLRNGRLEW
jgi:hypothetical protein